MLFRVLRGLLYFADNQVIRWFHIVNKGSTPDYVTTTLQRATSVVERYGFKRTLDIFASGVLDYLAELRRSGRSIASSTRCLRAIKMFSRWLVRNRRNHGDRLAIFHG